ncbi:MAG: Com family DNA-binding transcriptional regulator [Deltaproteobacteria bacterium]|nr:Com family DNA-binding transcriptional regulator [Deltaproteobacteria bacterium]
MQVTVECGGCARLLTVKVDPQEVTTIICPTCGWKGKRSLDGKVVETEPR